MNRRKFLRNTAALSAPLFLKGMPVFAGNGLTHPWLDSLAKSTNSCSRILVIIQLNGGNDGLNMVIPKDKYTELTAARPDLMIPLANVLSLNNLGSTGTNTTTGLHPSMTGIQSLYNSGKIAFIQGVSYPNPNYSHFQAQDIFFSSPSTSALPLDTGWMGRTLDATYPGFPAGYPIIPTVQDPLAIQIGGALPLSLQGPAINMGYNVPDPSSLIQVATATTAAAPTSDYGTEVTFLRQMQNQSNAYTTRIAAAWNGYSASNQSTMYPATGVNKLADQLKTVAHLIGGGLTTQVYIVNHPDSFDTHVSQVTSNSATTTGTHANNLTKLSVAIAAFMDDLAIMGKQSTVAGMTFSEFGRRVINNASTGTDHGTAAPVIFFGGALNGGVYGSSPNIPTISTSSTQVNMQYDFRQLYATVLQRWMCMSATRSQTLLNTTTATNTPLGIFNTSTVPLPNESIDASAVWNGNAAQVDFLAQGNDRFDTFVVERSTDAQHFSTVGVVERKDSTNGAQPYRFNDPRITAPKVFYRIKGLLTDGSVRYSAISELINGARAQALSIYPNPVTNYTIHIDFTEAVTELVEVELYDMMGNRVYYNSMTPDYGRLIFRVPYGLGTYTPYIIRVRWGTVDVKEQISFV